MKFIPDKTFVPVGVAVVVIGSIAMWITRIEIRTEASASALAVVDAKQDQYTKDVQEIREALAVIKVRVENIDLKIKEKR